ncbi:hypothetical protein GmHk_11G032439 [Glycine max]|nr:hypothetical protein GmHk_11G032439 [Glycine max]
MTVRLRRCQSTKGNRGKEEEWKVKQVELVNIGFFKTDVKTDVNYLILTSEIPEASNSRTKKKILQTVDKPWRQFKSDLTRKWALAADKDGVDDTVCEKCDISKEKWAKFCQTRRDPSWEDVRKKNTSHPEAKHCPPRVVSWGL